MNFKIGDRVTVLRDIYSGIPVGAAGEVFAIYGNPAKGPSALMYDVELASEEIVLPFYRNEIDHVRDDQAAPLVVCNDEPSDFSDVSVVYLSGPMRGHPEFNFPAFLEADKVLSGQGYAVDNPALRDLHKGFDPIAGEYADESYDVHSAFRWDVEAILACDSVVVLPGWQDSEGAVLEVTIARAIGTPVLEYPSLLPIDLPGLFDSSYGDIEPETVLQEAQRLIYGDRQKAYGHPYGDFERTGRLWAAILNLDEVTPEQVALCMVAVKVSRLAHKPKRDSAVDIAGYAGTFQMVVEERQRRAQKVA